MSASRTVFRVFIVLMAMMLAWMLYSVLLEWPYSTLLSFSADSGSDIAENHLNLVGANGTTNLTTNSFDSYGDHPTKSALWQFADTMQIPFGSYYYYYTQLPNMRSDEGMNEALARAIGCTGGYQYQTLLSTDTATATQAGKENNRTNSMTKNIPMALDMDEEDDVLMNYPEDSDTDGRFYTTGWY